jgi:histidinol-phosphatase (PHP family)
MLDYHIHTAVSADCEVPMKRMAQAARDAGIKEVGFSEHIDLGLPVGHDFTVDFDAYAAVFEETRREFSDLELRRGIEAGLDLQWKDVVSAMLNVHPCDFVIGSQHLVFGEDPYYETVWQQRTQREIYDEYMRVSLETAQYCDYYDILGHLGYVGKFCPFEDKLLRYEEYADAVDAILKTLIERGKALEVNTNGLYMTPSTMPETAILKRYYELGGEMLTIGSDAHYECVVGHAVAETVEVLKTIGFRYICAFDNRQPRFIKLL